jgi:hypothetical protein
MLRIEESKNFEQKVIATIGLNKPTDNHRSFYKDLFLFCKDNLEKWSVDDFVNDGALIPIRI